MSINSEVVMFIDADMTCSKSEEFGGNVRDKDACFQRIIARHYKVRIHKAEIR